MAQARKRISKKSKPARARSTSGLGMLCTGMIIGCVLTTLFLGWKKDPDHGLGSGIQQMLTNSLSNRPPADAQIDTQQQAQQQASPNYDFYMVLPEIEQVLPEASGREATGAAQPKTATPQPAQTQADSQDHYLLQAGSFAKQTEANQLKAKLALSGYESYIQKVTVDGKKFFRVRMGPFRKLDKLDKASRDLNSKGINAMRIKVSKG